MTTLEHVPQHTGHEFRRGPRYWAGWVLTVVIGLMLAMGGVMNTFGLGPAAEGMKKYGYPEGVRVPLGVVTLVCVALYLFPRTAVVGAILLTGYMGGAVNTHVRAGEPWYIAAVFGVLVWVALWLRDGRVRALVSLRR